MMYADMLIPRIEYPMSVQQIADKGILTCDGRYHVYLPGTGIEVLTIQRCERVFFHIPQTSADDLTWIIPYDRKEAQTTEYTAYGINGFDTMTGSASHLMVRPDYMLTVEEEGRGVSLLDQLRGT